MPISGFVLSFALLLAAVTLSGAAGEDAGFGVMGVTTPATPAHTTTPVVAAPTTAHPVTTTPAPVASTPTTVVVPASPGSSVPAPATTTSTMDVMNGDGTWGRNHTKPNPDHTWGHDHLQAPTHGMWEPPSWGHGDKHNEPECLANGPRCPSGCCLTSGKCQSGPTCTFALGARYGQFCNCTASAFCGTTADCSAGLCCVDNVCTSSYCTSNPDQLCSLFDTARCTTGCCLSTGRCRTTTASTTSTAVLGTFGGGSGYTPHGTCALTDYCLSSSICATGCCAGPTVTANPFQCVAGYVRAAGGGGSMPQSGCLDGALCNTGDNCMSGYCNPYCSPATGSIKICGPYEGSY